MKTLALILALLATPLFAAPDRVDAIRAALDAGDIDTLEDMLAEMQISAVSELDSTALREVTDRVFRTTNPARRAAISDWHEARPGSAFAAAAEAAMLLHEAGFYAEPADLGRGTTAANDAAKALAGQAIDLLVQGLDQDAGVGILHDLFGEANLYVNDPAMVFSALSEAFNLSPDRASILRIQHAAHVLFPADARMRFETCTVLAVHARDYDPELCLTEAAIRYYASGDEKDAAVRVLQRRDDPALDDVRRLWLLRDGRQDGSAGMQAIALHGRALEAGVPVGDWMREAMRLSAMFGAPAYEDEARNAGMAFVQTRLDDDPYNPDNAAFRAETYQFRYQLSQHADDLTAAQSAWRDAMQYGQYRYENWMLGAMIEASAAHPDLDRQASYWENAIALSRLSAPVLLTHVMMFDMALTGELAGADPRSPKGKAILRTSAAACPLVRAARVADAMCRTVWAGDQTFCDPAQPMYAPVPKILDLRRAGLCPTLATAPLSDLDYAPVDIPGLGVVTAAAQ